MAKRIVDALDKGARVVNSALRYVCMGLLFVMMLLGTGDVTGRYIFNKPLIGTVEIFGMLLPAIVLLGLAYTQEDRAHIRMEALFSRLSFRAQTILNILITTGMLFVSVLFLWRGTVLIGTYLRMHRVIPTIGVPQYLAQILVPVGTVMLCFVLIIQLLQYLLQLKEGG